MSDCKNAWPELHIKDFRRWEHVDDNTYSLKLVTASEVASVLSDADLLGELVRRGVLRVDEMVVGEVVDHRLTGRDYVESRYASDWQFVRWESDGRSE